MAQSLRKLVGKVLTCSNTSHHKTLSRLHLIQRFNPKHIISQNFSTTPQKLNNGWVDLTGWSVQKVSWSLSLFISLNFFTPWYDRYHPGITVTYKFSVQTSVWKVCMFELDVILYQSWKSNQIMELEWLNEWLLDQINILLTLN